MYNYESWIHYPRQSDVHIFMEVSEKLCSDFGTVDVIITTYMTHTCTISV